MWALSHRACHAAVNVACWLGVLACWVGEAEAGDSRSKTSRPGVTMAGETVSSGLDLEGRPHIWYERAVVQVCSVAVSRYAYVYTHDVCRCPDRLHSRGSRVLFFFCSVLARLAHEVPVPRAGCRQLITNYQQYFTACRRLWVCTSGIVHTCCDDLYGIAEGCWVSACGGTSRHANAYTSPKPDAERS